MEVSFIQKAIIAASNFDCHYSVAPVGEHEKKRDHWKTDTNEMKMTFT